MKVKTAKERRKEIRNKSLINEFMHDLKVIQGGKTAQDEEKDEHDSSKDTFHDGTLYSRKMIKDDF